MQRKWSNNDKIGKRRRKEGNNAKQIQIKREEYIYRERFKLEGEERASENKQMGEGANRERFGG